MKNRKIKFRYWNDVTKQMVSDPVMPYKEGWTIEQLFSERGWVWMQYTGFTNNGQEWYEGDILENDSDWYQITWDKDEGRWEATGIRSTGEILALSELLSQETWVQGNIFESPELLNS